MCGCVGLQKTHDDLKEKFLEEKAALEAKYLQLYGPLYNQVSPRGPRGTRPDAQHASAPVTPQTKRAAQAVCPVVPTQRGRGEAFVQIF